MKRFLLALAVLATAPLHADETSGTAPAAPASAPSKLSDDQLRIQGVFNTALPGTEKKNSLRFLFHPHFGDFTSSDYLRIPVGLRYGLTSNWEITGEIEGYVSHGFGSVAAFSDAGFADVHFGTKYHLKNLVFNTWDAAVGFDYLQPINHPPADVTDGLQHMAPYMTFSRRLEMDPHWRVFWGFGYDHVTTTSVAGELEKNQLGDDNVSVSGGIVWDRNRWHYTLETTVATSVTSTADGENEGTSIIMRPGAVYEIPTKYTRWIGGRWVVGGALRFSEGPDGFDFGGGVKVRVDFDLKKLLGRKPKSIGEK
jgi:hypothetical protein